jgi:hypothetical protein
MESRTILILSGLLSSFFVLSAIVTLDVRRKVRKGIRILRAMSHGIRKGYNQERSLAACPPIVQRYLLSSFHASQPPIHFARIRTSGEFRTSTDGEWTGLRAEAHYLATEPGFIWKARFGNSLLPTKTAWLELLQGRGYGSVKLLGLFTLLNPSGSEADISLLIRFLMECIWFPTALLPDQYLSWHSVDDYTAEAVLRYGSIKVSAVFSFDKDGQLLRITTNDKYRDFRNSFEKEHFTLHCSDFQIFQNIKIPTKVEFVWNLEDQDFSYGKFTVTNAHYEFS